MTTPTVLLTDLRSRVRDEIGDEAEVGVDTDYSDSQLNSYISRAVERYSELAPYVKKHTLLTVADQYLYELPSDTMDVRDVKWRNTPFTVPTNVAPTMRLEWKDNALLDVRDQIVKNFDQMTRTGWAQTNYADSYYPGAYLILYPTPTQPDQDVEVWYTARHPLYGDGTGYDTIPADHAEHVARLAVAIVLRREARIMVRQPDIASGQGLRVGSRPGKELLAEAQFLEQQVVDALNRPVATH